MHRRFPGAVELMEITACETTFTVFEEFNMSLTLKKKMKKLTNNMGENNHKTVKLTSNIYFKTR